VARYTTDWHYFFTFFCRHRSPWKYSKNNSLPHVSWRRHSPM